MLFYKILPFLLVFSSAFSQSSLYTPAYSFGPCAQVILLPKEVNYVCYAQPSAGFSYRFEMLSDSAASWGVLTRAIFRSGSAYAQQQGNRTVNTQYTDFNITRFNVGVYVHNQVANSNKWYINWGFYGTTLLWLQTQDRPYSSGTLIQFAPFQAGGFLELTRDFHLRNGSIIELLLPLVQLETRETSIPGLNFIFTTGMNYKFFRKKKQELNPQ